MTFDIYLFKLAMICFHDEFRVDDKIPASESSSLSSVPVTAVVTGPAVGADSSCEDAAWHDTSTKR